MDGIGDRHVGQLLRQYRTRRQVTQQELAGLSRVSVRTIRDIELGGCQQPRRETVRLVADGLGLTGRERVEFEAAAGRAATANELRERYGSDPVRPPAPIDALVGRRAELSTLAGLLATGHQRLVTVVGLSGMGKTRLALEVAGVLHDSRGFSVLWTSAGSADPAAGAARGPDQLSRLIRAELGTLFTSSDRAPAELPALIADRPTLLVLDGVTANGTASPVPSRAVSGIASGMAHGVRTDVILGLLRDCPGLRVLTTSRTRLDVQDERVFPLTPLPLPHSVTGDPDRLAPVPSIRLLTTYVRQFAPDFRLTPANAGAVVRLAQCLDGVPAALEAAAPLFMLYEPDVLRDCVEADPFDLLGSPTGTGQPGLRELFGQAVDALAPADRVLLGELARIDTGWSVEQAGAFTGLRTAVCARLVQRLLAHGMVRPEAGAERSRFRVLNLVRSLCTATAVRRPPDHGPATADARQRGSVAALPALAGATGSLFPAPRVG